VDKHVAILVWFGVLILTGWSCCCINSLAQADRDTLIIGEPPTIVALLVDEPQPDTPPIPVWESAAYSMGVGDDHVVAVRAANESTGVAGAFLLAVIMTESGGNHYRENGTVKRGKSGEIGAFQIMPSWKARLKRLYDLDVDLFDLNDNALACAHILMHSGYEPDDEATWGPALSKYNTGQDLNSTRYSREVLRVLAEIEEAE